MACEAAMSARAFRPAHEQEWFNREDTRLLKKFAEQAQLSFGIVKHWSSRQIVDADLPWLSCYPDGRSLTDLGLTPGQAEMLRKYADRTVDELCLAAEAGQ
jgi:hypothetical protein